MTTITAALVKELRDRTNAPMMECKKALTATNGDIEAAIEDLRKAGAAKADKKAGRIAAEGVINVNTNDANTQAVLIEVNSETDFVARDSNFVEFTQKITDIALNKHLADASDLLAAEYAPGTTVESARAELIAKIGENINVRRLMFVECEEGVLGTYVHSGRIGVIVHVRGGDIDLARGIAMHIAACNPSVVSPSDVPQALIEKEKEIYTAQAQESGKPAEIIEKMIQGRLNKFRDEVSLLGQPYVKDSGQSVGAVLKAEKAEVVSFMRFELGEGIEKKKDDFVREVMEQAQGSM